MSNSSNSSSAEQIISLPQGGGAVKGIGETFQPNLFTGTGNFTIPIAASPGRAGFGPQLSLQYSTGNGNGPFGLGWQLSIPRITRKTEKGLPRYDADDVLVMSGAEDLVPSLQPVDNPPPGYTITRYRPRTEGLFARIDMWVGDDGDVHWRATTKANVTSIYGRTAAARIADPDKPHHIFEWLLEETFDAKGNHVRYEYAQEERSLQINQISEQNRSYASQRYIRRIYYGNTPESLAANRRVGPERDGRNYLFEILFDYGDCSSDPAASYIAPPAPGMTEWVTDAWLPRDDPFSTFRAGFEVRTLRRCRRVLMFHHFSELSAVRKPETTTLVKSTVFSYGQNPNTRMSFLESVTVTGYRWDETDQEFKTASMPPVTFAYSKFRPHEQRYQSITAEGNDLPVLALNNPDYALVDLDGNGLPDVLHTSASGFRYWKNRGNGHFDRPHLMHHSPMGVTLSQPYVSFADMAGDGRADLLVLNGAVQGFFETTPETTWETFKHIHDMPSFSLADPNVRLVDLTGDGRSDVLLTRDHHFLWFECQGEDGYAAPQFVERKHNLNDFPDVYFNDPSGRVRLADMSGDGLNDIVLIHNGRIDYWPNLGYGRFGKRITMAQSPRLEANFDPARLFLTDLDGSGCADLVYVGFDRVHFWFNRCGNGWSEEQVIQGTPVTTNTTALQFADIFGAGTAALVWSYDFGQFPGSNYKVLDFCGGRKPYLLEEMNNNLGATTRVQYAPSTKFYLEDVANGQPWATKLPFPVQVVEKTEAIDHISQTKLVTTYKYHHGYFDGREREFRGFGRVDQFDTEVFEAFNGAGLHGDEATLTNHSQAYYVPPVLTKNWFHTGIYYERATNGQYQNEDTLLARYRDEYCHLDAEAFSLEQSVVEMGDAPHEAFRALRGALLRSEVYAIDGSQKEKHPYLVTESRYRVRQLQPKAANSHSVYLTTPEETLTYHYERNPADPRIGHEITLAVDPFGNVTDKVAIGYPRRQVPADLPEQGELKIVYTKVDFINQDDDPGFYYAGVPCQTRAFEVTGLQPANPNQPFKAADFDAIRFAEPLVVNPADFEPFQPDPPADLTVPKKRIIEWSRTYFRKNDAAAELDINLDGNGQPTRTYANRLPLGQLESLALPYESYQAALTNELVDLIFNDRANGVVRVEPDLLRQAGYTLEEGYWWQPSGQQSFAASSFFLPTIACDSFANQVITTYDVHALLVEAVEDALSNRTEAANDYRVLQPHQVTDPNGNRTAVAFDALGMVAATAVMGKAGESDGDLLEGFQTDPPLADRQQFIQQFIADPRAQAASLLGKATSRIVYDLERFQRTSRIVYDLERFQRAGQPSFAATLAREIHFHDPGGPESKIQISFSYSDGFGREIQKKIQAEAGNAPQRQPPVLLPGNDIHPGDLVRDGQGDLVQANTLQRWVGTGRTVFNNKGKPVKQYEPFFSATHLYEPEAEMTDAGVSPLLFYDPLERVVCTLHPNHTYEKVVFDPWRQVTWDVNDTIRVSVNPGDPSFDPKDDPDMGRYFERLPDDDYLLTWYDRRTDPAKALQAWPDADAQGRPLPDNAKRRAAEKLAADKAAAHAGTPTTAYLDSLGRPFLTQTHNGFNLDGTPILYPTRVRLDIEGNDRAIIDPRGITAFAHDFDLAGRKLGVNSVDAGHRCALPDALGRPLYAWDANGNTIYTAYDELRRPVEVWVRKNDAADFYLAQKTIYGESPGAPAGGNHRARIWKVYDGAGLAENVQYDFKGNLLQARRTLLADGTITEMAWGNRADPTRPAGFDEAAAQTHLEQNGGYLVKTGYDALNRVIRNETPGGTVQTFTYNDAGLLETLQVQEAGRAAETFVRSVEYDEKGRRTKIVYGNAVTTGYAYDPETFRLSQIASYRQGRSFDNPDLQSLHYTYDPAGNITEIRDAADSPLHRTIFNRNRRIEPASRYTYDPLYRLTGASGREHEAMTACHYQKSDQKQTEFFPIAPQPIANAQALSHYTENYTYDESGNLMEINHVGGWTRTQTYAPDSNRIQTSRAGCPYEGNLVRHDDNGNITRLQHLPDMKWDYRNQLVKVQLNHANRAEQANYAYYQYDAGGQRVRKIVIKGATTEERIYLGGYEIFRRRNRAGDETFRRETIQVMDDNERVALIETRKVDRDGSERGPARRVRYQLSNHLGSAALEVSDTNAAALISYEEYYSYGGTAYTAHLAGREHQQAAAQKRYRYSGKERDDETGLYYYGARYYAPWLGRWVSCDPIGMVDGVNIYIFVRNNPLLFVDVNGLASGSTPTVDDVSGQRFNEVERITKEVFKEIEENPANRNMSRADLGRLLEEGVRIRVVELGEVEGVWSIEVPLEGTRLDLREAETGTNIEIKLSERAKKRHQFKVQIQHTATEEGRHGIVVGETEGRGQWVSLDPQGGRFIRKDRTDQPIADPILGRPPVGDPGGFQLPPTTIHEPNPNESIHTYPEIDESTIGQIPPSTESDPITPIAIVAGVGAVVGVAALAVVAWPAIVAAAAVVASATEATALTAAVGAGAAVLVTTTTLNDEGPNKSNTGHR